MAETKSDSISPDLSESMDELNELESQDGQPEFSQNLLEPSEALQDTSDSERFQGKPTSVSSAVAFSPLVEQKVVEASIGDERKKAQGTAEALVEEMGKGRKDLNDLLAWKEGLRHLAVDYVVPHPYYDQWTKEANLFFRRVVIVNRRLQKLKKK